MPGRKATSGFTELRLLSVQGGSVVISKPGELVTIKDPISIPTLSQWALGLLAVLLLAMGTYSLPLRRRITATRK